MWDTRYRPLVLADVLGQEGSVKVLRARLAKAEAFDTSYIFAGAHGSGKTSVARILARAMLCQQPREDGDPCNVCDHCQACLSETMGAFTELDAASQGTTADMRRIVDHLGYDFPGVPKRIYLLDEAHRMSRDAQDVLLKPIEDKRVVFMFCTTEYAKIRDTIKSRCETYEIRKIKKEDILERARKILTLEGVEFEDDAILMVIDFVRGHVRDVLNKLETIAQLGPITVEAVRERLDLSVISLYYDVLLALQEPSRAIDLLETACDRVGPVQVAAGLAEAAMNAYRQVQKIDTDYSQLDRERAAEVYTRYGVETVSIARHFLGLGAYVSRLDLACSVVSFGTSGAPPAAPKPRVVAPPVLVAVPLAATVPVAPVAPASEPAKVLPVVAPVRNLTVVRPSPSTPAVKLYEDGNVPMCREDEAGMSKAYPKGIGPAVPIRKAVKVETKAPREEQPVGLTCYEFTALFNDCLHRVSPHVK